MLDWNGGSVAKKTIEAIKAGTDKVMSDCVRHSKRIVPVKTSTLQGSIQMRESREVGPFVVGTWGSIAVNYAIYVELGTKKMAAQPYLFPAADRFYPNLTDEINRRG